MTDKILLEECLSPFTLEPIVVKDNRVYVQLRDKLWLGIDLKINWNGTLWFNFWTTLSDTKVNFFMVHTGYRDHFSKLKKSWDWTNITSRDRMYIYLNWNWYIKDEEEAEKVATQAYYLFEDITQWNYYSLHSDKLINYNYFII